MPQIKFQDKSIYYDVHGEGPAVVLVHGFAENRKVFSGQTDFLKKKYRVIVPDLPGAGKSEMLPGQPGLDDFSELIFQIVRKEIPGQKIHLFGHSMGGYTTMAFVEKYPDLLLSFGLLHSSAYADTSEKIVIRKKGIQFIKEHGGHAFLKTITPGLFSSSSVIRHPEYITRLFALADNISDEALIQYYHAMIQRPDRASLLASSDIPVLFIIGQEDSVIPMDSAMAQSRLTQKAAVCILANSGHMGMWEEEEKTNNYLCNFLDGFQ